MDMDRTHQTGKLRPGNFSWGLIHWLSIHRNFILGVKMQMGPVSWELFSQVWVLPSWVWDCPCVAVWLTYLVQGAHSLSSLCSPCIRSHTLTLGMEILLPDFPFGFESRNMRSVMHSVLDWWLEETRGNFHLFWAQGTQHGNFLLHIIKAVLLSRVKVQPRRGIPSLMYFLWLCLIWIVKARLVNVNMHRDLVGSC